MYFPNNLLNVWFLLLTTLTSQGFKFPHLISPPKTPMYACKTKAYTLHCLHKCTCKNNKIVLFSLCYMRVLILSICLCSWVLMAGTFSQWHNYCTSLVAQLTWLNWTKLNQKPIKVNQTTGLVEFYSVIELTPTCSLLVVRLPNNQTKLNVIGPHRFFI